VAKEAELQAATATLKETQAEWNKAKKDEQALLVCFTSYTYRVCTHDDLSPRKELLTSNIIERKLFPVIFKTR
jgi:hypothetical protein